MLFTYILLKIAYIFQKKFYIDVSSESEPLTGAFQTVFLKQTESYPITQSV